MKKIIVTLLFATTGIALAEQPTPKNEPSFSTFYFSLDFEQRTCFLHCLDVADDKLFADQVDKMDIFVNCYKTCMKRKLRKRMTPDDEMKEHTRHLLGLNTKQ